MSDAPQPLGGQSLREYLYTDRPGEAPAQVQPTTSSEPQGFDAEGYARAGVEGMAGAAPLAILAARAPYAPLKAAAAPALLSGAASGMAEHFIHRNFPNAPEWAGPAAGLGVGMVTGGVPGVVNWARRHPYVTSGGGGLTGLAWAYHGFPIPSVHDISNNIYAIGMGAVGLPLLTGLKNVGRGAGKLLTYATGQVAATPRQIAGAVAPFIEPYAGAMGALAHKAENYLAPGLETQPKPVAEAPIPMRPIEQLPPPLMPQGKTRLQLDNP